MLYRTAQSTARVLLRAGNRRYATDAVAGSPAPPPSGGLSPLIKYGAPLALLAGVGYYATSESNTTPTVTSKTPKVDVKNPTPALVADKFVSFELKSVHDVNHNTKKFRFALPEGTTELGLPTASAVVTKFVKGTKADGKPDVVIRPYTPLEDPADGYTGYFDLLIKLYPNGPMSTHIFGLKPGDQLDIKGPIPKWPYKANEFKKVGLIAGGTGITPNLQVIQRILSNPEDKTKISLVFANIAEEDILLKSYFDDLQKKHSDRFNVHYVLEKPPRGWTQSVGYVSEKIVKEQMPKPGEGKVFICGPNNMLGAISGTKTPDYKQGEVGGILKKLGYTENDVYKF